MHLSGTEHSARANIFGGRLFFTLTSDPEWPESCRRLTGDSDADGKSEAKTNRLRRPQRQPPHGHLVLLSGETVSGVVRVVSRRAGSLVHYTFTV